jgi:hypothetical protein
MHMFADVWLHSFLTPRCCAPEEEATSTHKIGCVGPLSYLYILEERKVLGLVIGFNLRIVQFVLPLY